MQALLLLERYRGAEPWVSLRSWAEAAMMEEQQVTVWSGGLMWCGGLNKGQDVTVFLERNALSVGGSQEEEKKEVLAVLKVHSSQLSDCSKYFETCLSERWRKPSGSASSAVELALEVHADVACYTDCFSRMYSSFRKDFGEVKDSLELLKVASQIEYHELMDLISRYLSGIPWSEEDERRIREYAASPDFPRNHAEDLVCRLGLQVVEEDCQKKMCDMIQQSIRSALGFWDPMSSLEFSRNFIEELIEGIRPETSNSEFAKTLVSIVTKEAKEKFLEIESNCQEVSEVFEVEDFSEHINDMCWIMNLLLSAGVAEELVQCLLHLETFRNYLVSAATRFNNGLSRDETVKNEGFSMTMLVLTMYQEVVDGRLLLKTPERVALVEKWHMVLEAYLERQDYEDATRCLFLTLPFEEQIEHIHLRREDYVDARSLATLVRKNWATMEGKKTWSAIEEQSVQDLSTNNGKSAAVETAVGDEETRPNAKAKRKKPLGRQVRPQVQGDTRGQVRLPSS
ncbi:hypothetical protein M758_2G144400 [Ceratodon purpureus]|nr:hypothetical protein M758_2G144400 [Ceratodon purpureus]